MKIINEELITEITKAATKQFPSFGGNQDVSQSNNPISHALQDKPAIFAAGVSISEVVKFVLASIIGV